MSKQGVQNLALQNLTLKGQVNKLADAVNYMKLRDESNQRVIFNMLQKLGGSFEISHEDIALAAGRLIATVDEEKKTTTFAIEVPKEA